MSTQESTYKKKYAFTLAEVLITLGIIGVVAAMTMPVLIGKYNEETTMSKLKKFYTTMSQAQLMAIVDHGEIDTWDWVKTGQETDSDYIRAWYDKYFGKYIKGATVLDRKVLSGNEFVNSGITVQLPDGTIFNILDFHNGYLHFQYFTNYKTFMDETATNGKDRFLFGFNPYNPIPCKKRFNAYGCGLDDETLKTDALYGCNNTGGGKTYCVSLLQRNGWRVPEDYPIKF